MNKLSKEQREAVRELIRKTEYFDTCMYNSDLNEAEGVQKEIKNLEEKLGLNDETNS